MVPHEGDVGFRGFTIEVETCADVFGESIFEPVGADAQACPAGDGVCGVDEIEEGIV